MAAHKHERQSRVAGETAAMDEIPTEAKPILTRVHALGFSVFAERSTPASRKASRIMRGRLANCWDAALATQPIDPVVTAPVRRRAFRVIEGGKA